MHVLPCISVVDHQQLVLNIMTSNDMAVYVIGTMLKSVFSVRHYICLLRCMLSPARPSLCLSHSWIRQKLEVWIMQFSPYSSSIPLDFLAG